MVSDVAGSASGLSDPSTDSISVSVAAGSGLCVAWAEFGDRRVIFELVAQKGTEETVLIRETLSVTKKSSAWHDRLVDLRPWVGEEVSLTFSIHPLATQKHLAGA